MRIAMLLAGSLLLVAENAASETAECRAQVQQQDAQCQVLAEKRAAACPGGAGVAQTPACLELSAEIASTCTRRPCAPPPRKGKRNAKPKGGMAKGKGASMSGPSMGGESMATPKTTKAPANR